jgi:hypothetical protein
MSMPTGIFSSAASTPATRSEPPDEGTARVRQAGRVDPIRRTWSLEPPTTPAGDDLRPPSRAVFVRGWRPPSARCPGLFSRFHRQWARMRACGLAGRNELASGFLRPGRSAWSAGCR